MWSKLFEVKNGYAAEVWKELFDAEGVSNRVVPPLVNDRIHRLKGVVAAQQVQVRHWNAQ